MYSLLLFPVVYYVWNCFPFNKKTPLIYDFVNTIDFNCCLALCWILVGGMRLALKHNRSEALEGLNFTPFFHFTKMIELAKTPISVLHIKTYALF